MINKNEIFSTVTLPTEWFKLATKLINETPSFKILGYCDFEKSKLTPRELMDIQQRMIEEFGGEDEIS